MTLTQYFMTTAVALVSAIWICVVGVDLGRRYRPCGSQPNILMFSFSILLCVTTLIYSGLLLATLYEVWQDTLR